MVPKDILLTHLMTGRGRTTSKTTQQHPTYHLVAEHRWGAEDNTSLIATETRVAHPRYHPPARWAASQRRRTVDHQHHGCRTQTCRTARNDLLFVVSSARRDYDPRTTSPNSGPVDQVHSLPRPTHQCDRAALANLPRTCHDQRHRHYRTLPGTIGRTALLGTKTSGGVVLANRQAMAVQTIRRTAAHRSRHSDRAIRRYRA